MIPLNDVSPIAAAPSDRDSIIQTDIWHHNSLVAWGGLRPGGAVTCHLPSRIEPWASTMGGRAACMPNMGILCLWTVEFGYDDWTGATLCRRCFDKSGKPKLKWRPEGGWFSYKKKPKEEVLLRHGTPDEERRAIAVGKILNMPREAQDDGDGIRRIVEV